MTTIKDVAKKAGVSFKTVSRVVNGVKTVDPELQAKVRKAIDELQYQPNLSARQLRGAATSLAFVYDNPNSHYVIELQEGIIEECRSRSFEVVIHPCDSSSKTIYEELSLLSRRKDVAGLILSPPLSESKALVRRLVAAGIEVATVRSDVEKAKSPIPLISVDDRQAGIELTEHLLELGHESIAFLSGDESHQSTVERQKGYEIAIERHGLRVQRRLIRKGRYSFESGVKRTDVLLSSRPEVTAIVASNDEIAAGVLYTARRKGLKIPEQLSIVGFENSPFSRQSWPNLTTAQQSNREIGRKAAEYLIDFMREKQKQGRSSKAIPKTLSIRPEVMIRQSTAPPPNSARQ